MLRYSLAALAVLIGCSTPSSGQVGLDQVDSLIGKVSLDSLTSYVGALSGIDPVMVSDSVLLWQRNDSTGERDTVWISDTLVTLTNRRMATNDVATYYLDRMLASFGLDTVMNIPVVDKPWVQNLVAIKRGALYPEKFYILCAHYDGVQAGPGADDNASGTAAVLEAARLLATTTPNATLVFALWDGEEKGLIGSKVFAGIASEADQDIAAVINLDMIGWDGDDDHVVEIHTDFASSFIANDVVRTINQHGIDLKPALEYPGIRASDHYSFWLSGYPAILVIEEFNGGDFNPRYHEAGDSLQYFNMAYFHEMAKLALGMMARYAVEVPPVVHVDSKVFLAGAYAGADTMGVAPAFAAVRPLVQPYADTLFDGTPLDHDSMTTVAEFPESTIDWVLASLRTGPGHATEIEGTRRAAFLTNHGSIADTNGMMLTFPGVAPGPYYLVLRHRNHLSIMSADTLDLSDGIGSWDFTTSTEKAYTSGATALKDLGDGNFGMFGSDANADAQITTIDFNRWLVDTKAVKTGYLQTDFDLDGQVTVSDFNRWLQNTKAAAESQVPDP